jgi:hypothetical protein
MALDSMLDFFGRLESAIANRYIEEPPAMAFFAYWLRKMFTMEEHKTKATLDVQERMRKYESNYGPGDKTMKSLYDRMRRHFPNDSLNPEPRAVRSEESFEASRGDARLQASHSRATTPDGSNSRVSADATVACIRQISPNELFRVAAICCEHSLPQSSFRF